MANFDRQPTQLDRRQLRRSFERAAPTYDAAAVLQREVSARMLERLEYIKLRPTRILDAGCGTGRAIRSLQSRYGQAEVIALDLAYNMVREARGKTPWLDRLLNTYGKGSVLPICADVEHLPLRDGVVQLIWSNLAFQWCDDLSGVMRECLRVLEEEGLLMFSTFGPDTLKELRAAFAQVDHYTHTNRFIDLHDIGDLLVNAGFADPVMDMEIISLTYETLTALMRDLKAIGAHNMTQGRSRGLQGKKRWRALEAAFEAYRYEGRLSVSFEVIYGHAWKPKRKTVDDGRQIIRWAKTG